MRFISVRDLRNRSGQIWRDLPQERDMVVTSNGKPIAILSATSEDTVEESLAAIRQARAMAAVAAMQARSVKAGLHRMTLKEINAEIEAARKARKR